MKSALKHLLDCLDATNELDGDVTDTEVRELMFGAVAKGFIFQAPGYIVPPDFSLYNKPHANGMVQAALAEFIAAACLAAERAGLITPQQRLDAFQDESVLSNQEHPFYWYFGSVDDLLQLSGLP